MIASGRAAVFTVGPIYGTNALDKRTQALLTEPGKPREQRDSRFRWPVPQPIIWRPQAPVDRVVVIRAESTVMDALKEAAKCCG